MRFPFVCPTVKSGQLRRKQPEFALFNLDDYMEREKSLEAVKSLRLAVKVGCFPPPQHGQTEIGWKLSWEESVGKRLKFCKQHDINVILGGDDMCREDVNRRHVREIDWCQDAIQYTSRRSSELANCIMLDVVDEADHQLDGWIPDVVVTPWRRGSEIPEAWPCLGGRGYLAEKENCRALAKNWAWWYGKNIKLQSEYLERAAVGIQRDMFWSCLICGIKERSTVNPLSGTHTVTFRGIRPRDLLAQVMIAAAYGASVFEVYSYDCNRWILERLHAKSGHVYTGIDYDDREFDFLKRAIEYVRMLWAGEHYEPTESGPWLFGRFENNAVGINRSQTALPNQIGRAHV